MTKAKHIVRVGLIALVLMGQAHQAGAAEQNYTSSKEGKIHAPKSYAMIEKSLLANETVGYWDATEVTYDTGLMDVVQQVLNNNPEVMYAEGWRVYSNPNKVDYKYTYPKEELEKRKTETKKEVDNVLDKIIKKGYTEYDKVKAIHDYVVLNTAYDYDNYYSGKVPEESKTVHGTLTTGVAICSGYGKTMQLLLERVGIETSYIIGSSKGELHAWNQVKVDGEYYYLDSTWDDPTPNIDGAVSYNYFLVSGKQLQKTHDWDINGYPKATSEKYNYFQDFGNYGNEGAVDVKGRYYYSSKSNDGNLYTISKDGKGKKRVGKSRAPYFAISGDWVYFSNYSDNAKLYKMKLDGSKETKVNNIPVKDIKATGGNIHFEHVGTGKRLKISVAGK